MTKKLRANQAGRPIEELRAADAFVKSLRERADAYNGPYPLWHGWAIREGFLAGITYANETRDAPSPTAKP